MNNDLWEIVKVFIPEELRSKVLQELKRTDEKVILPGFGEAERGSRKITSITGRDYSLTPSQVQIIINIAERYPSLCTHKQAMSRLRPRDGAQDREYLRVVLSKIKSLYPEIRQHIVTEKWTGYRWRDSI